MKQISHSYMFSLFETLKSNSKFLRTLLDLVFPDD